MTINPGKSYFLKGSTLIGILTDQDRLWAGENVQRGPGVLIRRAGSAYAVSTRQGGQPSQSNSLPKPHDLSVYDRSVGTTAAISVTPGVINDNGGTSWTPTIGGEPINDQFGLPPAYPALEVAGSNTVVYAKSKVDTTTANITSVEILAADSLPSSSNSTWNLLLSTIVVNIGSKCSVTCLNDSVSGSQRFLYCGLLPIPDATGFRNFRM